MKKNHLDTPARREALRGKTTEDMVKSCSYATLMLLALAGNRPLETVIFNCEHSTISAVIVWLQERGTVIPADILAYLNIEDTRNA